MEAMRLFGCCAVVAVHFRFSRLIVLESIHALPIVVMTALIALGVYCVLIGTSFFLALALWFRAVQELLSQLHVQI
jgi:uncharacterized protein YjeT (DUF2065 family)